MKPEYLGNNIFREYLGAVFLQKLREEVSNAEGQPERNLNEENWKMASPGFRFIKFDLEYVYYEHIPDNNLSQ